MLGSIALAIVYGLKVNLSVAIVGMVNHTALELEEAQTSKGGNFSTYDSEIVCNFNDTNGNSTGSALEVSKFVYSAF